MEPQKQPMPPPTQPNQPTPVMDVVRPPKPSDDVKAPPTDAVPPETPPMKAEKDKKPAPQATPKPPRQPRTGVGLAIFATIIIVLGLAALMVYAYLRTNGISVL